MPNIHTSYLVAFHYFSGIAIFFIFLIALLTPKGGYIHKLSGKAFLILYLLMVLIGLISGVLYEFYYPDQSITLMLWAQAAFAISLLIQGMTSTRYKRFSSKCRLINLSVHLVAFFFAFVIIIYGGYLGQSISCGLGVALAILSAKNFCAYCLTSENRYTWKYFHASAMITAGILLPFNGTGFFGIHALMDKYTVVSWSRAFASYGGLLLILAATDFYLFMTYLKIKKPS